MHPLGGWVMVICNPVSGSGKGLAYLSGLCRKLDQEQVRYASEVTQRRGDAARLARAAAMSGCSALIVIGGDGTLFEVVNGVMNPREPGTPISFGNEVAVGLVQAGRGSDFGRSIGIPADPDAAYQRILQGRTTRIDLGYVAYTSFHGEERTRYFANAAGMGFDAEVTLRANASPIGRGGTIPYLSSLFATLGTYSNKRVHVKADSEEWRARVNSIIIANGQYFGGGMKIAPEAQLADGEFDVVVLGDLGKIDLVRNVPRVYDGSHVTHPKVSVTSARSVEVDSRDRLLLQADGEVLGMVPATFTIVPSAIRVIV